jgi:hypothetical protein
MAPITPSQSTPLRRLLCITSSPSNNLIVVNTTPRPSYTPIASKTTNPDYETVVESPITRKRKLDFRSLHKYGFQGPPLASSKSCPPAKKARIRAATKAHELSQAALIPEELEEEEGEDEDIPEKKKKTNAAGKRA